MDGDLGRMLQVFRFSGSEVFAKPVRFHEARSVFQRHGMGPQQFQSPVPVSEKAFMEIYALGQGRIDG